MNDRIIEDADARCARRVFRGQQEAVKLAAPLLPQEPR